MADRGLRLPHLNESVCDPLLQEPIKPPQTTDQPRKPTFVISSGEEEGNKGKKHRQRANIGRLQLASQEAPNG